MGTCHALGGLVLLFFPLVLVLWLGIPLLRVASRVAIVCTVGNRPALFVVLRAPAQGTRVLCSLLVAHVLES